MKYPLPLCCLVLTLFTAMSNSESHESKLTDNYRYTEADSELLEGEWQHPDKPARLYFDVKNGVAVVSEHGLADSEGLTVIDKLTPVANEKGLWTGQMYDGYQSRYVSVRIRVDGETLTVQTNEKGETVLILHR